MLKFISQKNILAVVLALLISIMFSGGCGTIIGNPENGSSTNANSEHGAGADHPASPDSEYYYPISIERFEVSPAEIDTNVNEGYFEISWEVDYSLPYDIYSFELYIVEDLNLGEENPAFKYNCDNTLDCNKIVTISVNYDSLDKLINFDSDGDGDTHGAYDDYFYLEALSGEAYLIGKACFYNTTKHEAICLTEVLSIQLMDNQ